MKLLTFLGAATAYETTYVMPDGQAHTAPFCGVALARFFPDTSMRVFVTPEARERHLKKFQELVEDYAIDLEPVDIRGGANEVELWEIFQAVVDNVDEGEQVIFDITHGFRSLPFLSFLAAAYLREVKDVRLQAVLYGNFEARDKSVEPNRAPVIDLTRFVSLLDWMIVADRFVRFGDAHDLAEQLRAAKPDFRQQQGDADIRDQAIRLGQAAAALDNVSLALRLIRPVEAMDACTLLQGRLSNAMTGIQTYARPFWPLVQRVTDAYAPLALSKAEQRRHQADMLARQRRMVHWYLERRQYVQAMAVAREWIITWAMFETGMQDPTDRKARKDVEKGFGKAIDQRATQSGAFDDYTFLNGGSLRGIRGIAKVLDLFSRLGDRRNDLLHAGMRSGALSAKDMESEIQRLCTALDNLPLPEAGSPPH